ncbi:pyridoxal phosphate-dependent aminotransferase [bacterium]|nr:pyridoxal phosphate-dependent aminotransferase [bacterium]
MTITSKRAKKVPPSPIRKLMPFATAAQQLGKKIYKINIGQPDIETPMSFWNAIHQYPSKVLAYGDARGLHDYSVELIKYYASAGIDIEADNLVVTTGGSESIVFAMMTIADPGDEIIVFEPFYPNYNGYSAMAGVNLIPIATSADDGYHLPTRSAIEEKITPKTRAILICSPNNPTGTVLTHAEIETIADIAQKHDLFVISDEVYREFIYEGEHTSIMHIPSLADRAILLDSISKRFSACGARVGCLICKNKEVSDAVWRLAQARLCPPTLEQIGATAVLKELDNKYFLDMKNEYCHRRNAAFEEVSKIDGAFCKKPSGAFYMMVTLPIKDIEVFAKWMLTDFDSNGETTMIAPGPGFYGTPGRGSNEARLAYVLREEDLRRAIQILAKGIKAFNNK